MSQLNQIIRASNYYQKWVGVKESLWGKRRQQVQNQYRCRSNAAPRAWAATRRSRRLPKTPPRPAAANAGRRRSSATRRSARPADELRSHPSHSRALSHAVSFSSSSSCIFNLFPRRVYRLLHLPHRIAAETYLTTCTISRKVILHNRCNTKCISQTCPSPRPCSSTS